MEQVSKQSFEAFVMAQDPLEMIDHLGSIQSSGAFDTCAVGMYTKHLNRQGHSVFESAATAGCLKSIYGSNAFESGNPPLTVYDYLNSKFKLIPTYGDLQKLIVQKNAEVG